MDRKIFMEQLAALLSDIPKQEREEALEYYERYFDEAEEDLQEAIRNLGSPQKVAEDIKSGMRGEYFYTESAVEDSYTQKHREIPSFYINEEKEEIGKKQKFWKWWNAQSNWMKVICFAAALAVIFPIAGAIFGTATGILESMVGIVFGVIGLLLSVLLAVLAVTITAYAAGIVGFVFGVIMLVSQPVTGLLALGIGCLGIAAGICFTLLSIWLYLKVLPWLVRMLVELFRKIWKGRRRPV